MLGATLVRVTATFVDRGSRATSYWIVAVDDPKLAERVVRDQVVSECLVEATNSPVLPGTVERLRLATGRAWRL
jgi:hypothetical protein